LTLSLTKPQFMKQCAEQTLDVMENVDEVQLVPILMFNCETEARWIEHVWIVSIEEGVSIGIALRNDGCHGGLRVTGIHLDGDYLRQQHELVLPGHECRCLDNFTSHISDLRIGNPDDLQNKINYYQQVIKVLSQYKEGVKALIKVDPSNLGHFQAIQRQVAQQHGHQSNHQPIQQQQARFQRHLTPPQGVSNGHGHRVHHSPSPSASANLSVNGVHGNSNGNGNVMSSRMPQNMSIPSGLPHVPSRRYPVHVVNQNYFVHSNQQQNYLVQQNPQNPMNHGVGIQSNGHYNGMTNGMNNGMGNTMSNRMGNTMNNGMANVVANGTANIYQMH